MPFQNDILGGASGQGGAYTIDQSVRFDDGDSAYLNKTFGSAGNRKTWTFSCWYKNTVIDSYQKIFGAGANVDTSNNYTTRLYIPQRT